MSMSLTITMSMIKSQCQGVHFFFHLLHQMSIANAQPLTDTNWIQWVLCTEIRNRKMAISFKKPTQSIYALNYLTHRCFKVTNCSLTESKMVTFSLTKSNHRARSGAGGGGGGGGGGLYCTGRRSRLQVYESVGMSYERVEKSVISVLTS